jgi:hypothetical protein
VALINWNPGNDFDGNCGPDGCSIIDKPPQVVARVIQRAKQFALGFLYWLQNEVPRDNETSAQYDGSMSSSGFGYPNLMLRKDITQTDDGLSVAPYIREGRRLHSLVMVKEQDAQSPVQIGTNDEFRRYRSLKTYTDSLGLARYDFDIHPAEACGNFNITIFPGSAQVALGSLVPQQPVYGFLVGGAKSIGSTHIANPVYRVHSSEWNVGIAAGAAAAFSVLEGMEARDLFFEAEPKPKLRKLQLAIINGDGGGIYWWRDGQINNPPGNDLTRETDPVGYRAAQMVAVMGVITDGPIYSQYSRGYIPFFPLSNVTTIEARDWINKAFHIVTKYYCNFKNKEFLDADRYKDNCLLGNKDNIKINNEYVNLSFGDNRNKNENENENENKNNENKKVNININKNKDKFEYVTRADFMNMMVKAKCATQFTFNQEYNNNNNNNNKNKNHIIEKKQKSEEVAQCPPQFLPLVNVFSDVTSQPTKSIAEAGFLWNWLDGEIEGLPPKSELGTIPFFPQSYITRRSAAIWIWNFIASELQLL